MRRTRPAAAPQSARGLAQSTTLARNSIALTPRQVSVPRRGRDPTGRLAECGPQQVWIERAEDEGEREDNFRLVYSHSMVPGGLLVISKTQRLTPFTSLMMRLDSFSSSS
jgi:hypothetical protein